ncbi:MAG: SUF system NifU family Fe-S cluster assembly protein [Sneathiella sp.]|nr:SUF system NifU family Fe-S cluster assembly protein [Sneathiella sp.]
MMDDLKELYQEVILDHSKHPRNFGKLDPCSNEAHGYNPLCGDTLNVFLNLSSDDVIEEILFDGKGCAISIASASLMSEIVKGKTKVQASTLFDKFHDLVTKEDSTLLEDDDMERLVVLAGVKQFPMRVKCATLSWHALQSALNGNKDTTTE